MCSLFGVIDYEGYLNQRQMNRIVMTLARESEIRGRDATGIAYLTMDGLKIQKRPLPAHKMWFHVPRGTQAVMGHTRMATQGSEQNNYNNHPFSGTCGKMDFALAHNGILHNDRILRQSELLPKTEIETDSYIAVQLLEKQRTLNLSSVKMMAEMVEGSFSFTILDEANRLYFVKGSSPLHIRFFDELGIFLYTSTADIMERTMKALNLHHARSKNITISDGEIMALIPSGKMDRMVFQMPDYCEKFSQFGRCTPFHCAPDLSELFSVATCMGWSKGDILDLVKEGFDGEEIENILYHPERWDELWEMGGF